MVKEPPGKEIISVPDLVTTADGAAVEPAGVTDGGELTSAGDVAERRSQPPSGPRLNATNFPSGDQAMWSILLFFFSSSLMRSCQGPTFGWSESVSSGAVSSW